MSLPTRRPSTIGIAVLLAGALMGLGATPAAADPADDGITPAGPIAIDARHAPLPPEPAADPDIPPAHKLDADLRNSGGGVHTVFVQFAGAGAAVA